MKILVKFPTRERPEQFLHVLKGYIDNQVTKDVRYLISVDENDSSMSNEVLAHANEFYPDIVVVSGISTGKIHACNRDINDYMPSWDIILLASDDMHCVAEGWDSIIIQSMQQEYPDTDGVLYYPDGFTQLNTMCIMGRAYYDRFGYIYHPSYQSLFCDNEFHLVADQLEKQTYFDKTLFEHRHFANVKEVVRDGLYDRNEALFHVDRENFEKRKAINFDLNEQDPED